MRGATSSQSKDRRDKIRESKILKRRTKEQPHNYLTFKNPLVNITPKNLAECKCYRTNQILLFRRRMKEFRVTLLTL